MFPWHEDQQSATANSDSSSPSGVRSFRSSRGRPRCSLLGRAARHRPWPPVTGGLRGRILRDSKGSSQKVRTSREKSMYVGLHWDGFEDVLRVYFEMDPSRRFRIHVHPCFFWTPSVFWVVRKVQHVVFQVAGLPNPIRLDVLVGCPTPPNPRKDRGRRSTDLLTPSMAPRRWWRRSVPFDVPSRT